MAKNIYYNFLAPSAMSFKVTHEGRYMTVRFSMPYQGAARFMTTDKSLADKIMAHRWFRKGLITLQKEEIEEKPVIVKAAPSVAPPPSRPSFSLGKMKMGGKMPSNAASAVVGNTAQSSEESSVQIAEDSGTGGVDAGGSAPLPDDASVVAEDTDAGISSQLTLESVESFLDAKEYLSVVHGIDSTQIKSKVQLAEVMAQLGIEFPNYSL